MKVILDTTGSCFRYIRLRIWFLVKWYLFVNLNFHNSVEAWRGQRRINICRWNINSISKRIIPRVPLSGINNEISCGFVCFFGTPKGMYTNGNFCSFHIGTIGGKWLFIYNRLGKEWDPHFSFVIIGTSEQCHFNVPAWKLK